MAAEYRQSNKAISGFAHQWVENAPTGVRIFDQPGGADPPTGGPASEGEYKPEIMHDYNPLPK